MSDFTIWELQKSQLLKAGEHMKRHVEVVVVDASKVIVAAFPTVEGAQEYVYLRARVAELEKDHEEACAGWGAAQDRVVADDG